MLLCGPPFPPAYALFVRSEINKMKKPIYRLFFLLIIPSSFVFGDESTKEEKIAKFNFRLGLNSTWQSKDDYFNSGWSGYGFIFEPQLTKTFSIAFSYNSLELNRTSNQSNDLNFDYLNTSETYLMLRYRYTLNKVSFFPEIGIGRMKEVANTAILGVGVLYRLYDQFFMSFIFDRSFLFEFPNLGGSSGWSTDHFKIVINVSYLFRLRKKL
jgi:hypothetical protein